MLILVHAGVQRIAVACGFPNVGSQVRVLLIFSSETQPKFGYPHQNLDFNKWIGVFPFIIHVRTKPQMVRTTLLCRIRICAAKFTGIPNLYDSWLGTERDSLVHTLLASHRAPEKLLVPGKVYQEGQQTGPGERLYRVQLRLCGSKYS